MPNDRRFPGMKLIKFELFKLQNPDTGCYSVIFEIKEKLLYAHKNTLISASETFASMLSDRWNLNKDEPIKIEGYGYDEFYQFITFLYSNQCQLTDENIFTMTDIAEFYGVHLFKEHCEKYLNAMRITITNVFQLMDAADKYSITPLKECVQNFVSKSFTSVINSDGFLKASKANVHELVIAYRNKALPENLFRVIFKWAEKRALDELAFDPTLNLNDVIKNEISDFLPYIYFSFMDWDFLQEFVVPKSFVFSSPAKMNKVLSDRISRPLVKVTNSLGQTLYGNLIPQKPTIQNIKSLKSICSKREGISSWWEKSYEIPLTPSPLKLSADVEWFLIYYGSGEIGVKRRCMIQQNDYLISEMIVLPSRFRATPGCKIEID